jgi:hypothetical protein
MRFMMIVKASKDSEAGKMPSEELLTAMGKYNDELMKAGVLLDLSGLRPSSKGARIHRDPVPLPGLSPFLLAHLPQLCRP